MIPQRQMEASYTGPAASEKIASSGAAQKVFCVHCGTKVHEKLVDAKTLKFCVSCGKKHPENLLQLAAGGGGGGDAAKADESRMPMRIELAMAGYNKIGCDKIRQQVLWNS